MNKKLLKATAATCAILAAQAAPAQEIFDLGVIVVTGALTPTEAARTGATVEIISEEALENGATSLADTLDRTAGISAASNGGLGTNTQISIRGLPARYVGVRLDGIDISDPSATQVIYDFGGLIGSGLSRVEIVKGSQSALFGSEAVAGVIDMRTTNKDAKLGFSADLNAEIGSFGTYGATARIGHRTQTGGLSFGVSHISSDGISARAGDAEKDGFDQVLVTLAGDVSLGETVTLGFSGFYRDAEVDIDRSTTDNSGTNFTEQSGARVYAQFDTDYGTHELSYAMFSSERRDPGGFTPRFEGNRSELRYRGSADIGTSTLTFGLERTVEDFATTTESGESATNSAIAEVLFRPSESVDLAFALRYDDDDDFGSHVSGRLALAWQAGPDTTIRAIASTGYRAPSLYERFSAFGDPTLAVEKSRSLEFGIEHRFAKGSFVKATVFRTEIDDLINFDFAATGCGSAFGCYAQVAGKTVSKGIELAARYKVNDMFSVFGNYTFTDAKTGATRLARVPRHDVVLGVDAMFNDRLSGQFTVQHVADVVPSPFAPATNKVDDYTLANAGLSYKLSDKASVYLRGENLFDADYETAGGFNRPGRAFYVGLRADF